MNRARIGVVFAFLGVFAIWGCAQNSSTPTAAAKNNRLQDEVKALTAARDQLRQDLKAALTEKEQLLDEVAKLKLVVKERDDLQAQLAARTNERDLSQAQIDQIKRAMKALMEQVEGMGPASAAPVTTAASKPAGNS
jgi:outer membrane murein-binding lipoprotein Lpp